MSELKTVMFHKPGAKLKPSDLSKLRKAGFVCVEVEDFDAISFPAIAGGGITFCPPNDEMGLMILRAANKSMMFEDYLGREIFKAMKKKAGIV